MKIKLDNFQDILDENYILLVTSNSKEKDAVNKILNPKNNVDLNLNSKGCYIGLIDNIIVVHLSGTSGVASIDSISRIVIEFTSNRDIPQPKAVLMAGFCWGNPNKTKSGQTIISNTIYSLNSSVVKEGNPQFKEKIFQSKLANEYLVSDCLNGSLASLETLIAGNEYRDIILSQYPTILGGEMEGFGYIPTLVSKGVPWLIIKTISDFADIQFSRDVQEDSAKSVANYIPHLIKEISIELEMDDSMGRLEHLKNILKGNTIHINRTEFTEESLNDFLNDMIGPVVESKLQEYFYALDKSGDSTFVRYFCDVILEIAQNSFKHGESKEFEISFHSKAIILQDDGTDFDFAQIKGSRGGATAWKKIKESFIDKEYVRYSHTKPNIYKFHLENAKDFLNNLREKCSIRIRPGTVGAIQSRYQILEYDESCTSVYLKDKHNRMSSRRHSIIEQVRKLLEKDITVYISVHNEFEAMEYQNALVDFGEKLVVLYD